MIGAMSDLVLCMGSSMRVQPACQMPMGCKLSGGKIVMINLQKTPADPVCDLIIHEQVDKVIKMVMAKLEIPIPDFRRNYRLKITVSEDKKSLKFTGVDSNGACYTIFKTMRVNGIAPAAAQFPQNARQVQPYSQAITKNNISEFSIQCSFQGHYNEPQLNLKVPFDVLCDHGSVEFNMVYHVPSGRFEKVEMINYDTREVIGLAEFTTGNEA